jgi:hypothetical protein
MPLLGASGVVPHTFKMSPLSSQKFFKAKFHPKLPALFKPSKRSNPYIRRLAAKDVLSASLTAQNAVRTREDVHFAAAEFGVSDTQRDMVLSSVW